MNWHTEKLFAAVGSGGAFATVARALMEHYTEGGPLPVDLGRQVAYRTIDTTCRVSASGVGLPVQLAVVDDNGARELSPDEVKQVGTEVAGWTQLERETLLGTAARAPAEDLPTLDVRAPSEQVAEKAQPSDLSKTK